MKTIPKKLISNYLEQRFLQKNQEMELRETGGKKFVEGYAMKWDKLSAEIGYYYKFRERFKMGSVGDYLDEGNDVKALIHHDNSKVVGRRKYNTVEINEDEIGIRYKVELPDTSQGNDLYESIKRRDIDGVSVGFIMEVEQWDETDENNIIRIIEKAKLPEFSFTAWAAYSSTTADVRTGFNCNYNFGSYIKKTMQKFKMFEQLNNLKK